MSTSSFNPSSDPLRPTRRTNVPSPLSSPTNNFTPDYPTSQTQTTTPTNTTPPIPLPILLKLLLFTFLMIFAPISTYFLLANTVLSGTKSGNTWAGAAAAGVANVVLVGYVVVAFLEDGGEEGKVEVKKDR